MPTPHVFLIGHSLAARQMLQITEAVLAEFPGLRVEHVNNPGRPVSNRPNFSGEGSISILAIEGVSEVDHVRRRMQSGPVIVVPVAEKPIPGRDLLAAASAAGAPMVALNEAGARNAALLAVAMFAANGAVKLRAALDAFRARQTGAVLRTSLPTV